MRPRAQPASRSFGRDFLQGRELLSQGRIAEAYEAFARAAATEPGNKKFQKKKAEFGGLLSNKASSQEEAAIDNDPSGAAGFSGQALSTEPDNSRAKLISDALVRKAATAKATLNDAQVTCASVSSYGSVFL